VAMQEILHRLRKDSVMFMAAEELPLPYEYRFFVLDGLVSVMPDDVEDRTIIFLDCGNIDRNPADVLKRESAHILNIDHHHDNTCFGTVNHVIPEASCTAEIVWDLMRALEVEPSITIAEALYVGLVTDTGKFMYENTGTRAHVMAAELIEAGVDVHEIYRRLYEGIPYGKLELLARGLANIERYDEGRLTLTHLSERDYRETGAEENYSEGVIDHLRSVEGTAVAALVRDRLGPGQEGARKVSLRSSDDRVDVSVIARAQGGGGHRQAAGFSTRLPWPELVDFLRAAVRDQLSGLAAGHATPSPTAS
jgi:bifunctional oligoribonuclease and PAP phosphatase NrnA